jgi:hypothetical protein
MRTDLDNMNSIMTAAANQSNSGQSGTSGTTQP